MQTAPTPATRQPDLLLDGCIADQSAMLGVLMRLHNLNLTVLSVLIVEEGTGNGHAVDEPSNPFQGLS